jgi:choline-sulfatase
VWASRGRAAARAKDGAARPLGPRAVAWGIALALVAAVYVAWSSRSTLAAIETYKEHRLASILLAFRQLAAVAALGVAAAVLAAAIAWLGAAIDRALVGAPWLRAANPLRRAVPAAVVLGGAVTLGLVIAAHYLPPLRPVIPWRWLLDAAAAAAGGAAMLGWSRRPHRPRSRARRRRIAIAAAAVSAVVTPTTLIVWGAHPQAKGMAVSASPVLDRLIGVIRRANDFDGDGYGTLLGEGDCAPRDPRIGPHARDIPDNGIDENCRNGDATMRSLVPPAGDRMAVPDAFQNRDWNILLLTIDTVRYDHTGFGGYQRNTTPHLDALVEQSVSFSFANAPSAGTMASVPAILTSKFFHSGIALDEKRKKGMPPILKPENVLLPEIMKRGGYATGAILSHEYFNEWGMEQGVDDYDNSIGKKPDAFRVSSHESTNKALAWIDSRASAKWFLWVHYLDPHGRYVAHPDGPDWGSSEMDLYDGELRYTDAHVGRLLRELRAKPGGDRTIVIITSDHGDAFGEHGFTNHGQALYRELLHVPLIFHIPDLPLSRVVGGAVSPLDIVPTVADLCGIDVSDLSFEGRSLVPQIFYGKEDLDRVVFAETNYQGILRAAVSSRYKLVYDVKNDLHKLFDLTSDPWEKHDVSRKDPDGFATMREHLDAWLERVMFARDPTFNQAIGKVAEVLLDRAPTPRFEVPATTVDGGRIEILGWDLDPPDATYRPGDKLYAYVYLAVRDRPSGIFKLQLAGWLADAASFDPRGPVGTRIARSPSRTTAEGFLPSDRWLPGEHIRERFGIVLPDSWRDAPGDVIALGVTLTGPDGKLDVAGQASSSDPAMAVLGTVRLDRPPAPGEIPSDHERVGDPPGAPGLAPRRSPGGSPGASP